MKKIIIAPDKFKGSLTGLEFCEAVEHGIHKYIQDIEIHKFPLADGGDGTVEVIQYYLGGEPVRMRVHDPLMREIDATYLYSGNKKMAFIEMAEASGIRLLKDDELNPMLTSTYGTGELIKNAIERGAKHIILGIGGSSTNDAGMGMARALGYQFSNKYGEFLQGRGADLINLQKISDSEVIPEIRNVKFEVACDVDNAFFGLDGAAHIYSPQKGATSDMVLELDKGLQNFNTIVKKRYQKDLQNIKGAGAAGGLGAGCVLFLQANLKSGIELIKDIANFEDNVKDADWLITGEGKLDKQTFSGKVISGVIDSIENQKLAVFCGKNDLKKEDLTIHGISFLAEMISYAKDVDDSIRNAAVYLEQASAQFALEYLKNKDSH